MEVEITVPWFTQNLQNLFFAIQYSRERNGTRINIASEVCRFALLTTLGQKFI